MNDQLASYIRKHIMTVVSICVVGFLLLAAGEYFLYRQQMHLNNMVSEGFMQLKEAQNDNTDTEMQEEVNESDTMMR